MSAGTGVGSGERPGARLSSAAAPSTPSHSSARCRRSIACVGSSASARTRISVSRGKARAANTDELERIVDGWRFDVRRAVRRRCRRPEIRDRRLRCESCERARRRRRRAEDAEPVGQLAGAAHGGVPSAGRQAVGRGAAADRCRYGGERGNEGRHAHGNPERWKARIIADPVADAWGCRRRAASDEISRSACRCGSRERGEAAIPDRLATRDATRVDSGEPSAGSRACPFPPEFSRFSCSRGACSARRS